MIGNFSLWPHQETAIENTLVDWASDCPDALVSIPTGCGKTIFFTHLSSLIWQLGKRILVIAHTEELVDQPRGVFEQHFLPQHPKAKLGTVRAEQRDYDADILFATIQTLSQDGYLSLMKVLKYGQIDYLVIDETHHITADTYMGLKLRLKSLDGWTRGLEEHLVRVTWLRDDLPRERKEAGHDNELLQAILTKYGRTSRKVDRWMWMETFDFTKTNENPNLLTLGVTATPYRTDNISLGNAFPKVMERDSFTYILTIRQAIAQGLLAPIEPTVIQTKIGADLVDQGRVKDLWDAGNWGELLIEHWLKVCGEKPQPTLCFMPDILTSKGLVKLLGEKYRIVGGHVDGQICYLWDNEVKELAKVDRATLIQKFRDQEFPFLSNFGVATEGVDFPFLRVGIIARPTTSRTLYTQILGRFLRKDTGNPDKIARIIHVGFQGIALVDYTSITGEMLSEETEAIEKAFALLTAGGHDSTPPPCPKCQGPLKRIRGTREYQCELCLSTFHGGQEIDDQIPDILDPTKPSGKGTFAKYLQLFVEDAVAWYKDGNFWSVSIGVGGRNGDEAERTILIAPPGVIPRRPDGYSLIEVRRPVLGKEILGNRWNKYVRHELGPREGSFLGNPTDLETILELAQERINNYKESLLSDKDKKWRREPASEKQIAQLQRFGVPTNRPITKGDAGRIYAHKEALTYLRRKGIID